MYEIRSITKTKYFGIVSYGSYKTKREAIAAFKEHSTANYANAAEIRAHGLELVEYKPVVVMRLTAEEMA